MTCCYCTYYTSYQHDDEDVDYYQLLLVRLLLQSPLSCSRSRHPLLLLLPLHSRLYHKNPSREVPCPSNVTCWVAAIALESSRVRLADMSKQDPPSGWLLTSTVTCAKGLGFEDLVGQKDRSIFDVLVRTTCS